MISAPADRLAAALRLPRPPLAQTRRTTPQRPLVILSSKDVTQELRNRLDALFRGRAEFAHGPRAVPDQTVAIEAGERELDAVAAEAWLHGVDVDWSVLERGRRVPLPTYPFTRRRFWALDDLASPRPAAAPRPTEAASDDIEADLLALWRELFGIETIGLDDEFGDLGGTSLLSVRMVLELQHRHGVLVNVHRAGGSQATVRRIAQIARGLKSGAGRGAEDIDPVADGDGELIDRDLELPLGPLAPEAGGQDVLLTGATGFLGTFLLHELLEAVPGRVYCIVRAADEAEARERLRAAAERYALPEPDRDRVRLVLGDLRDVERLCAAHGELAVRVGHVVHCAARVVFTEPYRVLREDNVLPLVGLVRWARGAGIRDFAFVSTVAATHYAIGAGGRILETREQPLDPLQGGYGVGKWVGERLLEKAEADGMRVRIFRPGFILGSSTTGACNAKDLIWNVLASGLAVGAHPLDDRAMPMAPVDVVARAMAELSGAAGLSRHRAPPRGAAFGQPAADVRATHGRRARDEPRDDRAVAEACRPAGARDGERPALDDGAVRGRGTRAR